MAWFRFYDDVLDDPKVQRLPPETFKGWVNILCLTKRNGEVLPGISDIAFALRMSDAEVEQLIDKLTGFGLLDNTETGMKPHNWNARQYKSDVSTERVKRFRKRHETVSETPRARQSRTDTEADTEKKDISVNADDELPPIPEFLTRTPKREAEALFDEWWALVPHKVGKGQARGAYRTALKKTDPETLKAGIVRYARDVAGKDTEFIAHPATWLNGERWLDEPKRKTHGNRNRGNGTKRRSPHDTLLAAGAFAATSRPGKAPSVAPKPDDGGNRDADELAPGVPRIP